jgi:hypothetical protein
MKTQLGLFGLIALTTAITSAAADQGIYGRLDLEKFPKPEFINAKPILGDASKRASGKSIYVHVPPGYERHWQFHCKTYDACNVPVQFVTEHWFVKVYLPAVGAQDGREQRYLETRRERGVQRDGRARAEE